MVLPAFVSAGVDFEIGIFLVVNIAGVTANQWCDTKRYTAQCLKL